MDPKRYDASHIEVLEGLEAVRKRPGMYVGSTGERGLHQMVDEVLAYALDEALAGHADTIDVTITADGGLRVADNGRGIPVPAVESVLTDLFSGYPTSGRVGASVVNALSDRLAVEVRREGFRWTQEHSRGVPLGPPARNEATSERGTTITFWADEEIFETTRYSFTTLSQRLRELASLHHGVTVSLTDERRAPVVHQRYHGGVRGLVTHLNSHRGELVHPTVIAFAAADGTSSVEIAMQWCGSGEEAMHSFANLVRTVQGGTHEEGFREAVTASVNAHAREQGLLPGNEPGNDEEFTRDTVHRGLTAVVSVKLRDPEFHGATRTILGNAEVYEEVRTLVRRHLANWLDANPQEAADIVRSLTLRRGCAA
ncbi:hypothetical protein DEJ50_01235 [Streptomyces venezuelae]|uniref:DNA topoisomerase (ATP-hydrolyzing) n=1 Tax=Streptomyces venezuelae TaxID=54571 RepID=A0A5P2CXG4_STRVZ|nr:hypothetical protein DEJ50_01235 [Streptomyces venezuelae]